MIEVAEAEAMLEISRPGPKVTESVAPSTLILFGITVSYYFQYVHRMNVDDCPRKCKSMLTDLCSTSTTGSGALIVAVGCSVGATCA
jgi:hypothetical protein